MKDGQNDLYHYPRNTRRTYPQMLKTHTLFRQKVIRRRITWVLLFIIITYTYHIHIQQFLYTLPECRAYQAVRPRYIGNTLCRKLSNPYFFNVQGESYLSTTFSQKVVVLSIQN